MNTQHPTDRARSTLLQRTPLRRMGAIVVAVLSAAATAGFAPNAVAFDRGTGVTFTALSCNVHSGFHDGRGRATQTLFRHMIDAEGAAWLRVHFEDYNLGKSSYLILTSASDGDWQRFNSETLRKWQDTSGIFNGGAVELELYVAPGDEGVFVAVDSVIIGEFDAAQPIKDPTEGSIASLCFGDDDRGSSADARVGRIWFNAPNGNPGGCTAWLVSNGAVLSAGHCVDSDPDGCNGAGLPDAALDAGFLNAVVEFNVPQSLSNGIPIAASLNDQYPYDGAYAAWQYPGCDPNSRFVDIQTNGVGTDWSVFSIGRNSNTLLTAPVAQGSFHRVGALACTDDCTTCVTGFGVDNTPIGSVDSRCSGGSNPNGVCTNTLPQVCINTPTCPGGACCQPAGGSCNGQCNSRNLTQQSACGPYQDFHSEGTRRWHEYKTDTTPATSGSPVTVTAGSHQYAIGINTHSGCPDDGNIGTSFIQATLNQFLNSFLGAGTKHVDSDWGPCIGTCDGTVFEPYPNVAAAVQAVSDGRIVAVVPGNYPAAQGNTFTAGADGKSMTFVAPVGAATIGN